MENEGIGAVDPGHVCFQMSQQSSTGEQAPWASSPGKRQGFRRGLEFPNEALGLVWEEGEALPGEGNPTREIFNLSIPWVPFPTAVSISPLLFGGTGGGGVGRGWGPRPLPGNGCRSKTALAACS